jgi:hypothetical protein
MFKTSVGKSLIALVVATLPLAVSADSVDDMCLHSNNSKAACECASQKLKSSVDSVAYALYEEVGQQYMAGLRQGKSAGDAWDAAGNDVASEHNTSYMAILQKTNDIGKTHRAAIKSCTRS